MAIYAGFHIFNRSNTELFPITGYSLPFEIFRFVPDFSTAPTNISNKKVLWDFGDGTTSSQLTAYHNYQYPGNYTIQLTYFQVFNNQIYPSVSPLLSTIAIANYLPDTLILTVSAPLVQSSGESNLPIYLTRYNSYNTSLSNFSIKLSVSGNQSPYYNSNTYYSNKFSHLYSSSKFVVSGADGFTVVDYLKTNSIPVYTTVNGVSYFVGSSGTATFYYVEDFNL